MKKPKIMLTAIGVLAIAGGALAFKANHFGAQQYCYTTSTASTASCKVGIANVSFPAGAVRKYTLTNNTFRCTLITTCTKIGGLPIL